MCKYNNVCLSRVAVAPMPVSLWHTLSTYVQSQQCMYRCEHTLTQQGEVTEYLCYTKIGVEYTNYKLIMIEWQVNNGKKKSNAAIINQTIC
jgi:hypothetical protein